MRRPLATSAARGDFDYHVIYALLVEAAWIRMLASEDGAVGLRYANPTYATLPCRVWRNWPGNKKSRPRRL